MKLLKLDRIWDYSLVSTCVWVLSLWQQQQKSVYMYLRKEKKKEQSKVW